MASAVLSLTYPLISRRDLIFSLTRRELFARHAASLLGFAWTIIHPIVMVCIYWFVFGVGFKAQPMMNVPFVVWLTSGLVPWLLFSDAIGGATPSLVENSQLIRKTVFPAQSLPVVKLLAALVTHCIMLVLVVLLLLAHGMAISPGIFGIFYYGIGVSLLALAISWASAALNVFVRDVGQLVTVVLQVWFWLTPIFWDIGIMPERIQQVLRLNPMWYIIDGYRQCLLQPGMPMILSAEGVYFWLVTILMLWTGAWIFRRLQPHFGDVL